MINYIFSAKKIQPEICKSILFSDNSSELHKHVFWLKVDFLKRTTSQRSNVFDGEFKLFSFKYLLLYISGLKI